MTSGRSGSPSRNVDDHFLADARQEPRAEAPARPALRHAHPARAVLVLLALAVPVELHLHAAVLVGEDLFTRRPDHHRGLRAVDARALRLHLRPVGNRARRTGEAVRVGRRLGVLRNEAPVLRGVLDRREQVFLALVLALGVRHGEIRPGVEADAGTFAGDLLIGRLLVFDAQLGRGIARALRQIAAGVVEFFEFLLRQDGVDGLLVGGQRGRRRLEVVVAECPLAGAEAICVLPFPDAAHRADLRRGNDLRVGALGQPAVVVAEHHGVAAVVVEEVEVDAFLLQQPADEVVGGLAVLHAVVALLVLAVETPRLLADAEVG